MLGQFAARSTDDPPPPLASTPRAEVFRDGTARLYRMAKGSAGTTGARKPRARHPVLVVPSMINRWYIVDLRPGFSLVEALVAAGKFDVYVLDWGIPNDEDRYLEWDAIIARLGRMVRRVSRYCGGGPVGLLGYCMGSTLAGIYTALFPERVRSFVNLLGPFDFSMGGMLRRSVDERWFDAEAMVAAGNLGADQMQGGFVSMRPTAQISKWVSLVDRMGQPGALESFRALETWAGDNIPFPAAAYVTWIRDLYQRNQLVRGEHVACGRPVRLSRITCPVLTVATERDTICPLPSARALNEHVGSERRELFVVRGGHVGAVVGSRAASTLYPKLVEWFEGT